MSFLLRQSCFPIKIKIFVFTQATKFLTKSVGTMAIPTTLTNVCWGKRRVRCEGKGQGGRREGLRVKRGGEEGKAEVWR